MPSIDPAVKQARQAWKQADQTFPKPLRPVAPGHCLSNAFVTNFPANERHVADVRPRKKNPPSPNPRFHFHFSTLLRFTSRHVPMSAALDRRSDLILVHLDRSTLSGFDTCKQRSFVASSSRRQLFLFRPEKASSGNPRSCKVGAKARREWPTYAACLGGGDRW